MINLYETLKTFPGLSLQLTCRDLLFTQYECPQIEKKEKFFIERNLIIYVIRGKRIFHKNQQSWDLGEGSCMFIKKGTHISEKPVGEDWCVMAFFMPDDFLKHLIKENNSNLPLVNLPEAAIDHVLPLHVNDISRSFFGSMLPYFTQSPSPPENLLELKFKELVLSLLSENKNRRLLSYLHQLSNENEISMEEVMQNNYTFNLTLADYAKLTSKSIPSFQREFRKIFNDTPAKWVMRKRLSRAAELLENTSLSIADITYECGFENTTHFSRIFKEKMGSSPLQFRTGLQSSKAV
jgi:AraC family transcriptional regulator, exoenzyme S synthesis regulatory protein ExsA